MAAGGSEILVGLTVASVLATAAGTYVAYESQQQQASAAKSAGDYNKAIAENNATAAQQQAAADAALQRDKIRRIAGAQTASAAKSGASLDGTFQDVSFDTAVQGELDALSTEYKGRIAAERFRSQGNLAQMEGNNSASGYNTAAVGSLIGGIARTGDRSADLFKLKM